MGLVAVLLVLAAVGIMLGRRSAGGKPITLPGPAATTAPRTDVMFEPRTANFATTAASAVGAFTERARKGDGMIRIASQFENGPTQTPELLLARQRAEVVSQMLAASGVAKQRIHVYVLAVPKNSLKGSDGDRVQLSFY